MASISLGPGCSVEKRESGTWRIVFVSAGRRHRINLQTTDRATAISRGKSMYDKWQRGHADPWAKKQEDALLEDAIRAYEKTRGVELADGGRNNAWLMRKIAREHKVTYCAHLTPKLLRKVIYDHRNEQTRVTTYTKLAAVLRWMTGAGFYPSSPMDEVARPAKPRRAPKHLTRDQVERLMDAAPMLREMGPGRQFRNPLWYVDAIALYLATGVRREEGPRLAWGDVVWPDGANLGRLIVRDTKRKRDRVVSLVLALPLLYRLQAETRISDDPAEPILKAADGVSGISGRYLGRRLARVCQLARIPTTGLHALRHTFAVNMLRAGVSMRSVQMMLGHEDITTTQVYTTLTAEDVLQDAERAGRV